MDARTERAEDMAAVELRCGEQIERCREESDPGGATDGMEENICDRCVRIEERGESVKDQGRAENGAHVVRISESGYNFCVKDTEQKSGDRDDKADEGAGCADIEERAPGSNR